MCRWFATAAALFLIGCGPMGAEHQAGERCDQTKDVAVCLTAGRVLSCERACATGEMPGSCSGTAWVSKPCTACEGAGPPTKNCTDGLCSCD